MSSEKLRSRPSLHRLLFESELWLVFLLSFMILSSYIDLLLTSNGPFFGAGPRDRSIVFRACQLFVLGFRLITPLSYVYVAAVAAFHFIAKCNVNSSVILMLDVTNICNSSLSVPSFNASRLFNSKFIFWYPDNLFEYFFIEVVVLYVDGLRSYIFTLLWKTYPDTH